MRTSHLLLYATAILASTAIRLLDFSPLSVKLNETTDYAVKIEINKEELKRFLNSVVVIDFPENFSIGGNEGNQSDFINATIKMDASIESKYFTIKKMQNRIWFRVAAIFQYKYFQKYKSIIEHFKKETKVIEMVFKDLHNPKANPQKAIAFKLVDKCRNAVFLEVNDIRLKFMDHEYVITTSMDCKYLYLGFVSKVLFVYPKQPIPKNTLVKIHTDYDNYVRIKPNILFFRSGVVYPKKLQISVSTSYPLKEITFKFTLIKGNPKEYHFDKAVYKVVNLATEAEMSENDTPFCVPDLILFPPITKFHIDSQNPPFVIKLSHAFANKKRMRNPFYDFANNQMMAVEPEFFEFEPHQNAVFMIISPKRRFQFLELKLDRSMNFQFINFSGTLKSISEFSGLRESLEDKVMVYPDVNSFYLQTDRYISYQIQSLEDLMKSQFNEDGINQRSTIKKKMSHYSIGYIGPNDGRRFDLMSLKLDGKEYLSRKGEPHNYGFLDNVRKFKTLKDKLWLTDYILYPANYMIQLTANKPFEACMFMADKLSFQFLYAKINNISDLARRFCFKNHNKHKDFKYRLQRRYIKRRIYTSRSVSFFDEESNSHRISMAVSEFKEKSDFYGFLFLKSVSGQIYLSRFVMDVNNKHNPNMSRQMFFIQTCMPRKQLRFQLYTKHWNFDREFFILPSIPIFLKNYALYKLKDETCTTNPMVFIFYSVNFNNVELFKTTHFDEVVDSENKAIFKRFTPHTRIVRFEKHREYEHGIVLGAVLIPIRVFNTLGFWFVTRLFIINSRKDLVQVIEMRLDQHSNTITVTHTRPSASHYMAKFETFYVEKLPNYVEKAVSNDFDIFFTIRNLPIHDIYYLHMQSCLMDRYFKFKECYIDTTDGYLEFMTHNEVIIGYVGWTQRIAYGVIALFMIIIV